MSADTSPFCLVLVRHGETEWTELGLLHGRLDSPLSPTGLRHVRMTAERLSGEHFDAIYSSPLGRALHTAQILGQALGIQPVALDGLREMDFGWTEGKSLHLFDPDGTGARLFRPVMHFMQALTGERRGHFSARLRAAVHAIESCHPGGRVLVVTHWSAMSMLAAILVDGDPRNWRTRGPWAACGITELQLVGGSWEFTRINDHEHLIEKPSVESLI